MKRLAGFAIMLVAALVTATTPSMQAAAETEEDAPRAVTWLSAGDSYSSGEGVNGNEGNCAQSSFAWGPAAAEILDDRYEWDFETVVFTACTGAIAEDMFNRTEHGIANGLGDQWEWAVEQAGIPDDGRFDVITLSFGGNDIGFADIVMDCAFVPEVDFERGFLGGVIAAKDLAALPIADFVPGLADDCDAQEADLLRRIDNLRYHELLDEHMPMLLDQARNLTVDDFNLALRAWMLLADDQLGLTDNSDIHAHASRSLHLSQLPDGSWRLDANLPIDAGEALATQLNVLAERFRRSDRTAIAETGDTTLQRTPPNAEPTPSKNSCSAHQPPATTTPPKHSPTSTPASTTKPCSEGSAPAPTTSPNSTSPAPCRSTCSADSPATPASAACS